MNVIAFAPCSPVTTHGFNGGIPSRGPDMPAWVYGLIPIAIAAALVSIWLGERRRYWHARQAVERWAVQSGLFDIEAVTSSFRLAPRFGTRTEREVLFRVTARGDGEGWVRGWVKFHAGGSNGSGERIEHLWDPDRQGRGFPVREENARDHPQ